MLTLQKREPKWITLIAAGDDGIAVRAKFAPITRAMRRKAGRATRAALGDADVWADELTDDELDRVFAAGEAASRELIRLGLLEQPEPAWEGILDLSGKPAAVTAENVDLALDDDEFFAAADRLYVREEAMRDQEKNGSAASPNGTGEAATRGKDTASSAASAKTKAAAKSVRTPSTRSRRPKRRPSGTS